MFKSRWILSAISVLVLVLCVPGVTAGTEAVPESMQLSVSGKIADDKNVPLKAAIVRAEDVDSGIARIALTDAGGTFWLPLLKSGDYEVSAEKKGYGTASKRLRVDSSQKAINFTLKSLAIVPVSQLSSSDIIAQLPEGPGNIKMTTVGRCGSCHGLNKLLAPRSKSYWDYTMKRMQTILRYVEPSQNDTAAPRVLDYLATHLGSNSNLPNELGEKVKQSYREEIPWGHDVVFTEFEIPTPVAMAHTAVPDKRGNVWFTENKARKIGRLEIATGKIKEYPTHTPNANPHGITVAPDGTVWFTGNYSMIGRIDPKTDQVEEILVPRGPNGEEMGSHTIIVARSGKIWFTEHRKGSISSYDPETRQFKRYALEPGTTPYGMLEHGDDIFWFALDSGSKVGFLNAKTGEIKTFPTPTKNSVPFRFRFDAKGRMWFGEYGAGKLGMFDPSTEQFAEYEMPFRGSPYSVHVDGKGYVWMGSFDRDSLIRFNPDTKEMVEYPLPGSSAIVRDMWPDQEGRIWFVEWARNKVTSAELVSRPSQD